MSFICRQPVLAQKAHWGSKEGVMIRDRMWLWGLLMVTTAAIVAAAGLRSLAAESEANETATSQQTNSSESTRPQVDPRDLEHARRTVKMLDHIYKTAIVLITDKYVHTEEDFAAGAAAVTWFDAISKEGSHTVRLIDATGDPYDPANVAKSDFEKRAVKELKDGKEYVEQVVDKEGRPTLLAATPIPVVLEKCVMCHPHYRDAEDGQPIGALSYEMPIR
jgi:hypothetical protein